MPLDYYHLGEIRNEETQYCLDTMGRKSGEIVGMGYCHGLGGNQVRVCVFVIHHIFVISCSLFMFYSIGFCLYEEATSNVRR
jgi:hypothetical protein